ncbi:oxygen-independent coproporphyrinogen-3 oxidase [Bacillus mesophilus]|uniref:Heme chaperone HemW n=1 Tax=Bacillus mesophilus TaxID=1808955 RepID=A0A6M0Q5P7_9BACI|nr:radical SAM family heme chaperone HemW [Bacillus mesophilus]MBM7660776.1 oxygen-independent coproporphyrinogen-3 oxidase [Bacillus mesophilus]NEY71677.1 oxygen-independent coproporphyrinogen III oxidase [Bacillus mesophilus]
MIQAVYIHIPFCHQICHYCDFNKVFLKGQPVDEYLNHLNLEMRNTLQQVPTESVKTIFIGGGTPTALNEEQLAKLLDMIRFHFPNWSDDIEFTVEANPGDLTTEKLKVLKSGGINRLSIGVQSFNNELLKQIGRTHESNDVFAGIKRAREAGFSNISIDLIYSLPNQTIEDFKETLQQAFSLNIEHFSAYSLIIEPKTVFYNRMQKGKLPLPSHESEAAMFELLMDEMKKNGYEQYEISNFSKQGFESKHNLTYWDNEEYYGFGAGAHSYVQGKRIANAGPLKKYMTLVEEQGTPYIEEHIVSTKEKMEEELFLGLRKAEGVSIALFNKKYKISLEDLFREPIEENKKRELLKQENGYLFLTRTGKLLGNEVFQSFLG